MNDLLPSLREIAPTLLNVAYALALLALGWVASRWARRFLVRALQRASIDPALGTFLSSFAQYALLLVGVIAALDRLGVQTTSLVAVFASMGVAIGLALQGSLSNVASGVLLLLIRPFRIGDSVTIAGFTGEVREIGLFVTTLATADGVRITVGNAAVAAAVIHNHSLAAVRRIDVDVPIAHGQDLDVVTRALEAAVADVPALSPADEPRVLVVGLRAGGVDVRVFATCAPADTWAATGALRRAVYQRLVSAGIKLVDPPAVRPP